MCESTAYVLKDGKEEMVLENVDFLENSEDQVKLVNLFGEEKTIRAKVKTLSLVDHKIVLEPL
ncbi:MAG: CooT family nickel-binding protein [Deltaproteobacteria bacterium]|jgi:predicted RNA-binding protein|nr:CooT family nickel-binding protein [Deltaproteobacteria bacterium]MBW1737213.1 CooT family nickel-binding protein [Deltaproteobacteria bacterium]MBW1910404.1 CooT family nickel-binding protein [Deltaproteobacteria bacterium]MBW2033462.1 CooT family nickel-binding protein [Deltaproteobacteria bacterium]MBW2113509.1 CooT family nickel-binding protein [Deltaproteobacteria bacterium]